MLKPPLVFAVLLVAIGPAFGLTYEQAGENLTYFVYAQQAARHCEQKGVHAESSLGLWRSMHTRALNESVAAVKAKGKSEGLDSAGQDYLVSEVLAEIRIKVNGSISKNTVPCADFKAWLDGMNSRIKQ